MRVSSLNKKYVTLNCLRPDTISKNAYVNGAAMNSFQGLESERSRNKFGMTGASAQTFVTELPSKNRNYTLVDKQKVDFFVKTGKYSLPYFERILKNSNDERQTVETLYILDRMLDSDIKGIDKMYPVLARFNDTKSPNIQTFLAGIYRKIQVPDAFGPLVKMLIQNSLTDVKSANFDPNEEIGGAILSYINPQFKG